MEKTDIRNHFIELRSDMTQREVTGANARIRESLIQHLNWASIKSLHAYRSVASWNEADTMWLDSYVNATWPNLLLTYGDPDRSSLPPTAPLDLIFVPILTFDSQLNRLGFGGGWYDRFLAGQPDAVKVGIAYDLQESDTLPAEPHDIRLDMIVTETRILTK